MDWHVARFKGVRIPIYVIARGAQAESYDKLDELVNSMRLFQLSPNNAY